MAKTKTKSKNENMLTKKVGPLPVWGWGVVGVVFIYEYIKNKNSTAATAANSATSYQPDAYSSGYQQALSDAANGGLFGAGTSSGIGAGDGGGGGSTSLPTSTPSTPTSPTGYATSGSQASAASQIPVGPTPNPTISMSPPAPVATQTPPGFPPPNPVTPIGQGNPSGPYAGYQGEVVPNFFGPAPTGGGPIINTLNPATGTYFTTAQASAAGLPTQGTYAQPGLNPTLLPYAPVSGAGIMTG